MKNQLLGKSLTVVLPLVLGFLGGVSSALFPSHFQAFCAGLF